MKKVSRVMPIIGLFVVASLLLAGCGWWGNDATEAPTPDSIATPLSAPTETPTTIPTTIPPTPEPPVEPTALPEGEETNAAGSSLSIIETTDALTAISVGVNAEFEPFVFIDEAGNLAGFDIDLMTLLAAEGGFEVGYVKTPFVGIFDKVISGQFDIAISAITITEERQAKVDFTAPYFVSDQGSVSYFSAGQGLAVRADTITIESVDDLTANVAVAVKDGTTGADYVRDSTNAQIAVFPEIPPALVALADGGVDAIVADIAVLAGFIERHPDVGLKLVGGPLTEEAYGIAVNKEKADVLAALNAALAKVRDNGMYDQIFEKWFEAP